MATRVARAGGKAVRRPRVPGLRQRFVWLKMWCYEVVDRRQRMRRLCGPGNVQRSLGLFIPGHQLVVAERPVATDPEHRVERKVGGLKTRSDAGPGERGPAHAVHVRPRILTGA